MHVLMLGRYMHKLVYYYVFKLLSQLAALCRFGLPFSIGRGRPNLWIHNYLFASISHNVCLVPTSHWVFEHHISCFHVYRVKVSPTTPTNGSKHQ